MSNRDHLVQKSIVNSAGVATTVWVSPTDEAQLDSTLAELAPPGPAAFSERAERTKRDAAVVAAVGWGDAEERAESVPEALAALGYEHPEDEEGSFESRLESLQELVGEVFLNGSPQPHFGTDRGAADLAYYLDEAGYRPRGLPEEMKYLSSVLGAPRMDRDDLITFERPDGSPSHVAQRNYGISELIPDGSGDEAYEYVRRVAMLCWGEDWDGSGPKR